MSRKREFPAVPLALLEELEKRYPDQVPSSVPTPEGMGVLVGQQSVIRLLRKEFDKQNQP